MVSFKLKRDGTKIKTVQIIIDVSYHGFLESLDELVQLLGWTIIPRKGGDRNER